MRGLPAHSFELLEMASGSALPFDEIARSFSRTGGSPTEQVLTTAQTLNWLRASESGLAVPTPEGARLLEVGDYESRLRRALLDYVAIVRPPWLQNATHGRARLLAFAGKSIGQTFVEAQLAEGDGNDVVAFWDELAANARGQKSERLTEIGRMGERLSIDFETKRTGRKPKWIAIENNDDGYDLLSTLSSSDKAQMSIEVKASTSGVAGVMHLTRNEWERTFETDNHRFHLWDVRADQQPRLAILSPDALAPHIPTDAGLGEWQKSTIPFATFAPLFADPTSLLT
jgi:hypothetical protein